MEEVHGGTFTTHANDHALAHKILRAGYYWSRMESDCCQHCHMYADNIHMAPSALHNLTSPWPFMIGSIEPKASNRHRFILIPIDCFKKWVESASYANMTKSMVIKFIKRDIICCYGLLALIITNNRTNLNNKMMTELCEQFKIKHNNSTPYCQKMNGDVEEANKNIKKIVQKMVVIEVVLSIEVEIPSLRVLAEVKLDEFEWVQSQLDQFYLIEEKCLTAICHRQLYQQRIKNNFDRRVRPQVFKEGDLILKKRLPNVKDPQGKWAPNYEGPYVVKQTFLRGALVLVDLKGQ
ncbi:Pol polyprotein, partial [Mucuna pruriens]